MANDLAALAPPVIVGVAFIIGAALLLRHELAPKRRARDAGRAVDGEPPTDERGEGSES